MKKNKYDFADHPGFRPKGFFENLPSDKMLELNIFNDSIDVFRKAFMELSQHYNFTFYMEKGDISTEFTFYSRDTSRLSYSLGVYHGKALKEKQILDIINKK